MNRFLRVIGHTVFFVGAFLHTKIGYSQNIPLGTWRTHLPYDKITQVEAVGERIYAASPSGFFLYDKADKSTQTLSKIDGFAETKISALCYDPNLDVLAIAYESGNFDMLKNKNTIVNLNTIKNLDVTGSRRINHVAIFNGYAYLSCDIGLVVINIRKEEIYGSNTSLGTGNKQIPVYGTTILGDDLFLASSEGVKIISKKRTLENASLYRTFNNGIDQLGLPFKKFGFLGNLNGQVLAWCNDATTPASDFGFYSYNPSPGNWTKLNLNGYRPGPNIASVKISADTMLVCSSDSIVKIYKNKQGIIDWTYSRQPKFYPTPQQAVYDSDRKLWVADSKKGLIGTNGSDTLSIQPNGPSSDQPFRLYSYKDKIVSLAGGISSLYNFAGINSGVSFFDNGMWSTIGPGITPGFPTTLAYGFGVGDYSDAYYSNNKKSLYINSFGRGLIVKKDNGTYDSICRITPNTTLLPIIPSDTWYPTLRSTFIREDYNGKLWIGSVLTANTITWFDPKKNAWGVIPYLPNNDNTKYPVDCIIAPNNDKWVRLGTRYESSGTVWVIRDSVTSTVLTTATNNGKLPDNRVNDMALDGDGAMWLATDKGLCVFYSPSGVLAAGGANASTPIYDGRPVLENDALNAIVIDGGGRKWIGTRNNGLWLFNKDITQALAYFTADNSPLPSNSITDLAINEETGELFIATDQGMISYRTNGTGDAINVANECGDAYVFPNPVRPDFIGQVAISNITSNATVKITDISGKLAYEGTANGTTFVWNLKDYNGVAAKTGIYLAFVTASDGSGTCVQKLAVIR